MMVFATRTKGEPMTLNGAIAELAILHEHPMMPDIFKSAIQKIIETVSECEEPSAQPEPEIHWGYTPTYERPLADKEIVSRLRTIQMQVGGSYAIDRAIEIIEAVAERRTDEPDKQTDR